MSPIIFILNYATLIGLIRFFLFVAMYFAGLKDPVGSSTIPGGIILLISLYFIGVKYRDNFMNKYMSYGQAMRLNFMVCFIAMSLYAMLFYIFGISKPEFVTEYLNYQLMMFDEQAEILESFVNSDFVDAAIKEMENMTLGMLVQSLFMNLFFYGVFHSLIIAIFTYKKAPPFDTSNNE